MGKTSLIRLELGILACIIVLGGFLRLYHIGSYMTFLGDEGRDALAVRDILLGRNFPLIGPGTSVGNMYLGPLYYYLITPALLLSGFSPVGPAVFVAVIGLLTIGLLWWVARQWGIDGISALAVSALYAVSPVAIIYSRSSWNPNVMPFFALLCVYGIWRFNRNRSGLWLLVTSVSFAFVLNSHYLGLLLLPTLGLFWWYTKDKPLKSSFAAIIVFVFLMSPLFIFDVSHNWTNLQSLRTFFTQRQQTVSIRADKALPNLWPVWQQINTTLLAAGNQALGVVISVVLAAGSVLVFSRHLWQRKTMSAQWLLVFSWIIFGLVGFGLYKQHIYSHYFGFLFPAPFLLAGLLIHRSGIITRRVALIAVILLAVFNLSHTPLLSQPNRQLERTKQVADFITARSGKDPFNLALISDHNYDASYRYFLALSGSPYFPIQQLHTDQLFVICEYSSTPDDCQPINNPQYEIADFGWAKIDWQWPFPWQVMVYKLIPNPSGI